MEDNKVSIIICHHTGNLILRCLKSLENVNAQKIVVSSDFSFNYSNIQIRHTNRNEPAYKRNWGTEKAKGKYLVFMDDDVEVEKNCIENMVIFLDSNPDVGMVYAMLYKIDNHNIIDTSGSFLSWNGFLYETYIERANPAYILAGKSALCMIRNDLFTFILGGFDEDFVIYAEETDLSWRVWLAGCKVMVLPNAIGYHAFETVLKPKSYYNQKYIHYHGCKNYITMLIKNLPANKLYIVLINFMIWSFMSFCLLFKNRQAAKWIIQGLFYNVKNLRRILRKRRFIQATGDYSNSDFYTKNPPLIYYFRRFKDYIMHQLHG